MRKTDSRDWSKYEVKDSGKSENVSREKKDSRDWSKYEIKDEDVPRGNEENGYELSFAEPEEKEEPTITQDIIDSLLNVPSDVIDMATNLPGEVYGLGKQAFTNPGRAAKNALAGLGEGIHGKANIAGNIRDYLVKKKVLSKEFPSLRIPESILPKDIDFAKMLGIEGEEAGDSLIRGLTGFGSFKAGNAMNATSKLGKGAENAAHLGGYAASQNQNPLEAAALGKVMEGLASAGGKGLEATKKFNSPKSQLSIEELKANLENTKDTNTPLGRVIEDPYLTRKFENTLPDYPGSGAGEKMQEIGKQVTEKGHELVKKLGEEKGNENYGEITQKAIENAFFEAQKEKKSNYKKVNKIADSLGLKVDIFDLSKVARSRLNKISSSPLLNVDFKKDITDKLKEYEEIGSKQKQNKRTDFINNMAKFSSFLKETENIKNPNRIKDIEKKIRKNKGIFKREEGADISLEDANTYKGVLKDISDDYYNNGNTYAGRLYSDLRKGLVNDINRSINKTGNKELRSEYNNAEDYYSKSISPFDEKEIKKFITGGGDPDVILDTFIKKNKDSDRPHILNKLLRVLPKKHQDIVRKGYYRRAFEEGKFNPTKFKKLHEGLGEKQRSLLLNNPALEKEFNNYSKLVGINSESLKAMFNPPTGQKGLSFMPTLLSLVGAAVGGGSGASIGGLVGGIPGIAIGAGVPALLARRDTNKLTSESHREKVVNKLIKKKEKEKEKKESKNLDHVSKQIEKILKSLPSAIGKGSAGTETQLQNRRDKDGSR